MSSNLFDVNSSSSSSPTPAVAEQLCYLPCNFCNIILAVSVPCSSLFEIVTVRCGHCGNLWSVNMGAALHSLSASWQQQQQQQQKQIQHQLRSFPSLQHHPHQHQQQLPPGFPQQQYQNQGLRLQAPGVTPATNRMLEFAVANSPPLPTFCNKLNGGAMRIPIAGRGNEERSPLSRPPEKKQRVPSVYNQFIKEEIQRIKAINPEITHREAFSTAAKNWAHFPHIQFGLMLESNKQIRVPEGSNNKPASKAVAYNK